MKTIRIVITIILTFISACTFAKINNSQPSDNSNIIYSKPFSIFLFYGKMTNQRLNQVLRSNILMEKAKLYSVEMGYKLPKTNIFNDFFYKMLRAHLGLALNTTYQDDSRGNIYQINPYFKFSWIKFPWNKYLLTTFSFGEGVSYSSKIPDKEYGYNKAPSDLRKFLNYLSFDLALAIPTHPNIQLSYHIHHRSGCFGVYGTKNAGSTAIGIGILYLF